MEVLDIKQSQNKLLNIAKEFDRICRKYSIPYYMIGGTMLGAIRHKGFIPWDDDMDFGVPIEYYDRVLTLLQEELSSPYRLCTYTTVKGCASAFAKIDDTTTCIMDKCQDLKIQDQIGVNIDIFPLFLCDGLDFRIRRLQIIRTINRIIFTESSEGQYYKHIIKKTIRAIVPFERKHLLDLIWRLSSKIRGEKYMANLFGVAGFKEIIPCDVWGKGINYKFENTSFRGPDKYDDYLTRIYGNYMELPPVEKRKTHSSNVYTRT